MRQRPQRILITGYHGFVSQYLAMACARAYPEAQLFGLTHAASHRHVPEISGAAERTAPVIEIAGDITESAEMAQAIAQSRPDLVFHLAAMSSAAASWRDPGDVLRVNAIGFTRLVGAIQAASVTPRVIVVGSGEQYGVVPPELNPITEETPFHPANPYAVSKVAQDYLAAVFHTGFGLDLVRARPFNHFGPRQSDDFVIPSFARQIALMELGQMEPILRVGNLSARRDFLPVESVVEAYLALAERGRAGEVYNIGSGVAHSIDEILRLLLDLASLSIETRIDPERFRPSDAPLLCADSGKLQRDTGWRPDLQLAQALRRTLDYWRAVCRAAQPPAPEDAS
jgi:GDP-4-dehydro-6-deoxy-D-mannose reductase